MFVWLLLVVCAHAFVSVYVWLLLFLCAHALNECTCGFFLSCVRTLLYAYIRAALFTGASFVRLILNRAGSIFHFTAIPCGAEVVATIAVVVATIAEVVATIAEVFATMSSTASEAALHRKRASFNSF